MWSKQDKALSSWIMICYLIATRDLAKLYQCTKGTKDINKAVKWNIERFPDDFYFELTP